MSKMLILNDMGGEVMSVSEDITCTLRSQMKHHEPIVCFQQNQREEVRNMGEQTGALTAESGMHNTNYICYSFEPGIAKREGSDSRFVKDKSPTLRANAGDNQVAVCFQLCGDRDNPSVSTSDIAYCIPANPMSDRGQAVCYAVDSHPMDSRFEIAGDIAPTVTSKLLKGSADGPLILIENE